MSKKEKFHKPHPGNIVKRYVLRQIVPIIGEEDLK